MITVGYGGVETRSAKGKRLVTLTSTVNGGRVDTYQPNGKMLVELGAGPNGGLIDILNMTGESIANMYADAYGNGVVWAGNRKGKGRRLQPAP